MGAQRARTLLEGADQALAPAELIARTTDARARLVCFTDRGRALQQEARKVERQVEREWSRHLGPDRLALLRELLVDLRKITDPWWEESEG